MFEIRLEIEYEEAKLLCGSEPFEFVLRGVARRLIEAEVERLRFQTVVDGSVLEGGCYGES